MNALLLVSLLLVADPPAKPAPPSAEPKNVPATRTEIKDALEAHKTARPRLPFPPATENDKNAISRINNGRFRAYYLPSDARDGGFSREPDPAMTLDSTFKVKLFWVTSRVNNCYYCLGHQEHKLMTAGVSDDDIGALDGNCDKLKTEEKAAVLFTRKLTYEPHKLAPADIADLGKHFTPTQCAEILVTVAGYNATNRWTDGLNIPGEMSGDFFRKADSKVDFSTFKTVTSATYKDFVSKVAPIAAGASQAGLPGWDVRPKLEDRATVEAMWKECRTRTPILPLADAEAAKAINGDTTNWVRALTLFPKAMRGRAVGLKAAQDKGKLSPRIKAEIAWVASREDRAWYAANIAYERLKALGFSDDEVFALDGEAKDLPEKERLTLAVARKLAAAPATVTDVDIEGLRKHFSDFEVAEIVYTVCNAAFFNRVTEAYRLPLDR